jgi:hypothetical protein
VASHAVALLVLKLALTSALIAAATLAARRWGFVVGGLFAGLPLTSGPVSVFLALEQGKAFAAHAAQATLLGIMAVSVFCLAYIYTSRGLWWPESSLLALAFYFIATLGLSFVRLGAAAAALAVPVVIAVTLAATGTSPPFPALRRRSKWDLPGRMLAATATVILITACAAFVGPVWSGLLSPFPVFACIMAASTHRQHSSVAAQHVLRGVLIGSFGFSAFFIIVEVFLQHADPTAVYAAATAAALTVNAAAVAIVASRARRAGRLV